ncbi:pitrilysin family protein [uncultured Alistipes sp.]|uniref:M16 family metallopeptidase n=1 Tax=uncultured Alistipes sp. TaxID=538949 RepID=UPI002605B228|nr:pitrilysin family protein [uncultured Alistipes sp.]
MKRPPLIIPETVDVPQARRHTLSNGVNLYAIPSEEFEVLRFTFVFRAGTVVQRVPFSASSTLNMLSEGSERMTARQIAERLDFYGSNFEVNMDRDFVYVTFNTLSKFFTPTLEVAEQILLHPIFPEEELASYREKRKQGLAIERMKVDTIVRENFGKALFGEKHPYGITYPESAYDTLTRNDLTDLYRNRYTADNALIVCSGRIDDQVLKALCSLGEQLPRSGSGAGIELPKGESTPYRFTQRADAVQSSIRVGRLLFPRTHPDFIGMQVVATVLGGYFGSRLMQNLREEHGYTYGVGSAMINFEQAGYLAVATQVGTEVTASALQEIYREIERLRTEPVSEDELSLVKNIMIGEIMRVLDGPFGIADVTIENILCGKDNEAVTEGVRQIRATTPDDVLRLAQKYLRHEDLITAVAGSQNPLPSWNNP